ncbi:MAG TPA: hypothetical protein VGB53_07060 [Rubricoccaceae bacterium]|jgi:hypothetical protein
MLPTLRARFGSRLGAAFVAATLAATGGAPGAVAQGGFQTLDPFYRGEAAQRSFDGEFAVSAEAAVRDADLLGVAEPGTPASPLAFSGRVDFALLPQVDLSLVADLTGGVGRGPMGLSWVVVKPYWRNEATDYAIRVAVDPASEGGLGFRQTDVAFLSATTLSPDVTTDIALGIRRVRTGYTLAADAVAAGELGGDALLSAAPGEDGVRVVGQELRVSWGYNVVFDPAGSRLALGLVAEAGDYALVRAGGPTEDDRGRERIRSGIGWLRAGLEFSRPAYQLAPFMSIPLVTWADVRGEPVRYGPRPEKLRAGLRVMLR